MLEHRKIQGGLELEAWGLEPLTGITGGVQVVAGSGGSEYRWT